MRVLLLDKEKITTLILPVNIIGSYSVNDSKNRNVINIEAISEKWVLKSNSDIVVSKNNDLYDQIVLEDNESYVLKNRTDTREYTLYAVPYYDSSFVRLEIKNTNSFTIGNNNKINGYGSNQISIDGDNVLENQVKIERFNNVFRVENLNLKTPMYINNNYATQGIVTSKDLVFVGGIRFVLIRNMIIINNLNNTLMFDNNMFNMTKPLEYNLEINEEEQNEIEFGKEIFFSRPPRIKNTLEEKTMVIDSPPAEIKDQDMPLIFTIGSMLVMGVSSVTTACFSLIGVSNGTTTLSNALPSLIIAGVMVIGTIFFPMIQKFYTKRQKKKKEEERKNKYYNYLSQKRDEIQREIAIEEKILNTNYISFKDCADIIINDKKNLWERQINSDDFLELRVGTGNRPALIDVKYEQEKFTLDEDQLKKDMVTLVNSNNVLKNVPITVSFTENNVAAIVGNNGKCKQFVDGLLLQMVTFHGYDNLRFVVFTNDENASYWEKLRNTPYCFNEENSFRFYGTNLDEISQVSNYLDDLIGQRIDTVKNGSVNYSSFGTYYMILTDDIENVKKVEIINKILTSNGNYGFGLLILSDNFNVLPSECKKVINLDMPRNVNDINSNIIMEDNYIPDMIDFNIDNLLLKISNMKLEFTTGYHLPKSVSFLEMYNVGNVRQLNAENRWKSNNPSISLKAPVGIGDGGNLFYLDLHEKYHGPHGLVAGMTGSGKSEFIISYILSMALNYSPDEVAFVIIDYKGGGLAGAFENRETGVRLPHLVGTITNLDEADMKRSLASIQSELKRRQDVFNKARDELGENTMDIYKYQRLHREGKINEPMPHLFIISDEFAELKAQQPDFMDQLISAARIGRSLGVHLILATQKPSGVVNDQIWSNSKFKVCLKVQDRSDSQDMISRPDAAALKQIGRFYLLVGYNDYFAIGQSAWCGAQYYESEKRTTKIDSSINVIDDVGTILKSIEPIKQKNLGVHKGEELKNILEYIIEVSKKENVVPKKLWLDKIPNIIFIDNLIKKYNYVNEKHIIKPLIGEYDNPSRQMQGAVSLSLSKDGNTIIYGSAGSGKDLLMGTIVYSTIAYHGPDEVNFYLLDFGSEALKVFSKAPQVGDVIFSSDEEKVENLFKLLAKTLESRKKILSNFTGDFESYSLENSDLPLIIVMINNYEAFSELYENYEDIMIKLTREGKKYGIIFIISASATNSIRYKLSQNFKAMITMQLNDKYDYTNVFGNIGGLIPSKGIGRGLIKVSDVFEFQTAYVVEQDKYNSFMGEFCNSLAESTNIKAKKVPILPDVVGFNDVKEFIKGINQIPVGIEKDTLNPSIVDFNKFNTILLAQELEGVNNFLEAVSYEFIMSADNYTYIFDADKSNDLSILSGNIVSSNFSNTITDIEKYIVGLNDIFEKSGNLSSLNSYKKCMIIIYGFNKFITSISDDDKKKILNIVKINNDINMCSFIFADSTYDMKKSEFEDIFKNVMVNPIGIYVGNGIDQQFTIKVNFSRGLNQEIDNDSGYVVKNGMTKLVKFVIGGKNGK